MKLPNTGAIGGMPRQPSTGQLQSTIAKGARDDNRALNANYNAIETIARDASKAVGMHNKFQSQEAFTKANSQMKAWESENANKEYFNGGDIPEGIDVKTTETIINEQGEEVEVMRTRIPAYEVYPQMRRKQQSAINASASKDITFSGARSDFSRQMEERSMKEDATVTAGASKAQRTQIRKSQAVEIKRSLMNRDYETAMLMAQNFEGSNAEVKAQVDSVKYFAEFDTYNQSMSEDNIPAMQNSLEALTDEDYSGQLNEVQRLATINQLKSKVAQNQTRVANSRKTAGTLLAYDTDQTIKRMKAGEDIDPEVLSQLSSKIQAGDTGSDAWARRKYEISTLSHLAPALAEFRTLPMDEREQDIREMRASAKDQEDHYRIDQFETANKASIKAMNDDPLRYSDTTGVVKLEPLVAKQDGGVGFVPSSLESRVTQATATDERFGVSNTPLFTNEEMDSIVSDLNSGTDDEKLEFIGNILESMDSNQAGRVWSQLSGRKAGNFAILGDLVGENEVSIARTILQGESVIRETPEVLGSWNGDMKPVMMDMMGNAFSSSPVTRGNVLESIKSAYAGLSAQAHDFTGVLNEDRMEQAVNQVAGGTIKFGNNTITLPERNMEPKEFDAFLRDAPIEYIRELGGIKGYDTESSMSSMMNSIRDGSMRLVAMGKNAYVIFDPETGKYLQKNTPDRDTRYERQMTEYDSRVSSRKNVLDYKIQNSAQVGRKAEEFTTDGEIDYAGLGEYYGGDLIQKPTPTVTASGAFVLKYSPQADQRGTLSKMWDSVMGDY